MPEFEIWYSETYTYKAWFTANDKEQALELLEQVESDEIEMDDLPGFGKKDKSYEIEMDLPSLEELK